MAGFLTLTTAFWPGQSLSHTPLWNLKVLISQVIQQSTESKLQIEDSLKDRNAKPWSRIFLPFPSINCFLIKEAKISLKPKVNGWLRFLLSSIGTYPTSFYNMLSYRGVTRRTMICIEFMLSLLLESWHSTNGLVITTYQGCNNLGHSHSTLTWVRSYHREEKRRETSTT